MSQRSAPTTPTKRNAADSGLNDYRDDDDDRDDMLRPVAASHIVLERTQSAQTQHCSFDRCLLPVARAGTLCAQHVRIMNVGQEAMADAWQRYDGDIWRAILAEPTPLGAQALYAVHAYMEHEPPNQVPMGNCDACDQFGLSLWSVAIRRANDDTRRRRLLVCWSCVRAQKTTDEEGEEEEGEGEEAAARRPLTDINEHA